MRTKFWSKNLKGRDQDVDWRIILKLSYENTVRRYGLDASGSGYGPVVGSCEVMNHRVTYKTGNFMTC